MIPSFPQETPICSRLDGADKQTMPPYVIGPRTTNPMEAMACLTELHPVSNQTLYEGSFLFETGSHVSQAGQKL